MITIHLQVQEDYIQEFMNTLPKDKVVVIEENFKENKMLLEQELLNYQNNLSDFISYKQSMKDFTSWLKDKE